jgi:hypothetical protein
VGKVGLGLYGKNVKMVVQEALKLDVRLGYSRAFSKDVHAIEFDL